MKKLYFLLTALALCLAVSAAALTGCVSDDMDTEPSAVPSVSPTSQATAKPSARPTAAASAEPSASASESPEASADAGSTQRTGSIEGFMEGGIVNPEDVPEITGLFTDSEEHAGMTIQSITYKLYEGRQAYYVILQGVGMEDRAYYVFADGSMINADEIPGD